jgi:general secretion pathway protein A
MDYLDFYKLTQEPFSNAPISKFYYNSAQHSKAMVRLMYAVDTMKGLALLIGDIGTGKTTLARRMIDDLPEEEYESALLVIIHSGINADWLLRKIALQLGVEDPPDDKLRLLSQLYDRLIELDEAGKKAVVLIDEAQMLNNREIMEEFRGLLNLEVPNRKLLTFIFFGLPEIEKNLALDPPLQQRVALKVRLESFNEESTEAYIRHRLRTAGGNSDLIDSKAIAAVNHFSKGTPRMINTICDNALFEGYLMKSASITSTIVNTVADDLGLNIIDIASKRSSTVAVPASETEDIDFEANEEPPEEAESVAATPAEETDDLDDVLGELEELSQTEEESSPEPEPKSVTESKKKAAAAEEESDDSIDDMFSDIMDIEQSADAQASPEPEAPVVEEPKPKKENADLDEIDDLLDSLDAD